MKTVEERVAEVKAEVQMKPITGFAYVIECVAKQLTQQAAEWQIALNEAVAETNSIGALGHATDRLRHAMNEQERLAKELAAEKLRGAQAVAMERQNWEAYRDGEKGRIEAAVAAALSRNRKPGLTYGNCPHCNATATESAIRDAIKHEGYCIMRGRAKASPSPVSEPEPPLWRAKFGVGGRAKQFYFIDEYGNPYTPPGPDPVKPRPGSLLDEVVEKLRKLEDRLDAIQKPG